MRQHHWYHSDHPMLGKNQHPMSMEHLQLDIPGSKIIMLRILKSRSKSKISGVTKMYISEGPFLVMVHSFCASRDESSSETYFGSTGHASNQLLLQIQYLSSGSKRFSSKSLQVKHTKSESKKVLLYWANAYSSKNVATAKLTFLDGFLFFSLLNLFDGGMYLSSSSLSANSWRISSSRFNK